MSYDYLLKLIVVGDPCVGKTALVDSWMDRPFICSYSPTIGVDFSCRCIKIQDSIIKTHIWDTAGQVNFSSIISMYYKDCAGAFVVFDLGRESSFKSVSYWIHQIREKNKEIPIMLLGNKSKKKNIVIDDERINTFAKEEGVKYMKISSRHSENTEKAFQTLITEIYQNIDVHDLLNKKLPNGVRSGILIDKKINRILNKKRQENKDDIKGCFCCTIS
jgi:small GTP-binding protein